MNKVLLVFDGGNFSQGAFDFACNINAKKPCLLTGVFLTSIDYSTFLGYPIGFNSNMLAELIEDDNKKVEQSIALFKKLCEKNNIEYRVHDDQGGESLQELKKETRFADMLILGSENFFNVENVLHYSECPILIVPETYQFPSKIILSYDGSASSVYAIKMFTYLFSDFNNSKTVLVYADSKEATDIPDKIYIEELVARHFNDLSLFKLEAEPRKYFNVWLQEEKDAMIVAGAYGRSGISEILKQSFVAEIIADHEFPIFIAHTH